MKTVKIKQLIDEGENVLAIASYEYINPKKETLPGSCRGLEGEQRAVAVTYHLF